MNEKKQLESWTGDFGNDYIERNELTDWKIPLAVKAFQPILNNIEIESVLEVGSNVGINLAAINSIMDKKIKIFAVEPNKTAHGKLMENAGATGITEAWNCDAFNLPLEDGSVDLAFTCGVLIHIHPNNLGKAADEIFRVSRKYVLCMEYFSHEPEEKPYRGQDGLLFKRDFGVYYLDRFENLECIDYGFLWHRDNKLYDNVNWWLFKKSN